MRSTTVGWLTLMLRVLPVTAHHMWINRSRPELRDSNSQPAEPLTSTPIRAPMASADRMAVKRRSGFSDGRPLGSGSIGERLSLGGGLSPSYPLSVFSGRPKRCDREQFNQIFTRH